jgi:hypothetical protein
VALKFADVGHLMAPWGVHRRWVARLEEEMFAQVGGARAHVCVCVCGVCLR